MADLRLNGKVAVVTGGVSGMGLAGVEAFVAHGARVVVADIQTEKGLALEAASDGRIKFVTCDIRDEADIEAAVAAAVSSFGGLDIMYHNAAAVGDKAGVEDISVDGWDDTLSMILRSGVLCIKHSVAPMRARGGGSIILTSSAAAVALGGSGPYAYTVGKAGVISSGQYAAFALGPDRIRVNTIIPGGFRTSIWSGHKGAGAEMGDQLGHSADHFAKMQPLPYAGEVEDIAQAALFLASDESRFITGVALPVDGGLVLHRNHHATAAGQMGALDEAAANIAS